jgi:decaprenyl-diphosphate synthase subunit 1
VFNIQLSQDTHKNAKESMNHDLKDLHKDIRTLFTTNSPILKDISNYYFDGSGKSIRPMIITLMAKCINSQNSLNAKITQDQRKIAMIAEMIHVASLIHDDIIDTSDLRRGKDSVNQKWDCQKAVFAGDYIIAIASQLLAKIGNNDVIKVISTILEDLVLGELMQFGSKEKDNERFDHYLKKTYRKTASLIANSCKAVAILSPITNDELVNLSFECGKNIGIAFQIIDDILDFTSKNDILGKPGTGADLRLGLATAPVLFAASEYPELNAMIMRRFSNQDDVNKAFEYVLKSNGIEESRYLAEKYCDNSISYLNRLKSNEQNDYLKYLIKYIAKRDK